MIAMEAITMNKEENILSILKRNKWEWTFESGEVLLIMQGQGDETTRELWNNIYSSDFVDDTHAADNYGEKIDLCKSIMEQSEDEAIKNFYNDNKDSDFELCFNEEDNKHRIIISNIESTNVLFGVPLYTLILQDTLDMGPVTMGGSIGTNYESEEEIKELLNYFDKNTHKLKDNSKYRFLLSLKKVIKYYGLSNINSINSVMLLDSKSYPYTIQVNGISLRVPRSFKDNKENKENTYPITEGKNRIISWQ